MAFEPSTLLSRTNAGDTELRTPQNGLSLGQRKLLTFLEQPQALEEFAAGHGLPLDKLDRDLVKLASLNLVAIDGETSGTQASTVVLGGARGPTALMRYGLVPVLLIGAAIVYYVLVPAGSGRKPNATATPIAGTPALPPASVAAPGSAAAPVTPGSVPAPSLPALALAIDVAPHARDAAPARTAESLPAKPPVSAPREPAMTHDGTQLSAGGDAAHGPAADDAPSRDSARAAFVPASAPASASVSASASAPASAPVPLPVVPSAPPAVAGANARADLARPVLPPTDAATGVAGSAMTAKPATVPVNVAATTPLPAAPEKPLPAALPANAAETVQAARPAGTDATKLAMAAPSSADARPPAHAKLLPLTREDPEFPREAISRGVADGNVKALLAIDATGKVTGVRIVDARPARVFDRAVKDALAHWTFPAGDAGRSTEVEIAFRRN
jgi:periplasmic protein TonB